jgi:hypothetical protein
VKGSWRARPRRAAKRKGDLIWITTVVSASMLEATALDYGLLVIPTDWGSQVGFDRCTLMGIRGWVSYSQQAAATAAEATGFYTAVYVTDASVTVNSMDPSTATEYQDFDTLWTDGMSLTQTTGTAGPFLSRQIDIKTRRKLTSASSVRAAGFVDSDTATPRVNINGVFRSLLKLDAS